MDGAAIQQKVYAGYAKAAAIIGTSFDQYRPAGADSPLAAGNKVASILAALDSSPSYGFHKPNEYGDATWYALINASAIQAGDYITNGTGTYFVAAKQPLLPVLMVECTQTIRVVRQQLQAAVGAVGYGGLQTAAEVPVIGSTDPATHWPASILLGGGGGGQGLGLPGGVMPAGRRILLPPSVPVTLLAGDLVYDDLGRRFIITAPELTELGWRINATEVHA